jgi:hypothetical protein
VLPSHIAQWCRALSYHTKATITIAQALKASTLSIAIPDGLLTTKAFRAVYNPSKKGAALFPFMADHKSMLSFINSAIGARRRAEKIDLEASKTAAAELEAAVATASGTETSESPAPAKKTEAGKRSRKQQREDNTGTD